MHTLDTFSPAPEPSQFSEGGLVLFLSGAVAALGSLLFEFETAIISQTTEDLREVFGLSDSLLGFFVSCALIGTLVGVAAAGRPTD